MATKTQITVALIAGISTIAAAAVAGFFGLFAGSPNRHAGEAPGEGAFVTHGPQSPIVITRGDVSISYGVPQAIVERWQRTLTEQGLAQHVVDERVRELADKQKRLESTLGERSPEDSVSRDALHQLSTGNLGRAADVLTKDLTARIERKQFSTAANRAEDLRRLRELQLEPLQAKSYGDLATDLRKRPIETVPTPSPAPPNVAYRPGLGGSPLTGTLGDAAGDGWQTSWLDLRPPTSFKKGERLFIKVEGNAENVLVRLLPNASSPSSSDGIVETTRKVPAGGILDVKLERDHPNVKQISVHAGRRAWGRPLGDNNGNVKVVRIECGR